MIFSGERQERGVCMAVEFHCPTCGGTLRAGDGPAGRLVRCGGCLSVLKVPNAPPLDPADDATTDALHTRVELLPVAHPVAPTPPVPLQRRPDSAARDRFPDEPDDEAPTGRSKSFWISITLLAIALGTCGCCGLAAVILPDPTWETHDSAQGGFRVELPGKPTPDMANRVRSQPGRVHDGVEGTHLWTRNENYIVAYRNPPKRAAGVSDAEFLKSEVEAITADRTAIRHVSRNEAKVFDGFPGREFEYEFTKGGIVTGRVILAGPRVYVLVAGGQSTKSGNENVERFLDSFEITDPKILAAKKVSKEAEKKKKERDDGDED